MRPGLCNQHLRAAGKAQGAEEGVWVCVSKPEWILPVADEGFLFLIFFFDRGCFPGLV